MKKWKIILLLAYSVILIDGCKKPVVYEPGWVGKWEIYQVDSAYNVWWEDLRSTLRLL